MTDSSFLDPFCTSGNSPTQWIDPPAVPGTLTRTAGKARLVGPPTAPVVLVLGGISAQADLAWWSETVGPGRAVDTTRTRVLSLDWEITEGASTHDQARELIRVLDALHIHRLTRAIGCSYGGMVVLAAAEIAPHRFDELVILGAAHRPHPLATAWRWIQREVTSLGGEAGLAIARALAMTTYRSDRELDRRFAGNTDGLTDWLEHHGRAFTERFTSEEFSVLSAAIDSHRVDPTKISTPTHVIGFDSDLLAPPWLLEELTELLPNARSTQIRTEFGHDGFLLETEAVAAAIGDAGEMAREVGPAPTPEIPAQTSRPTFGLEERVVPFPARRTA